MGSQGVAHHWHDHKQEVGTIHSLQVVDNQVVDNQMVDDQVVDNQVVDSLHDQMVVHDLDKQVVDSLEGHPLRRDRGQVVDPLRRDRG